MMSTTDAYVSERFRLILDSEELSLYKDLLASNLNPEKIKILTEILSEVYRDGIDQILSARLLENGDIIGRFRDEDRIFVFRVGEEISYKLEPERREDKKDKAKDPKRKKVTKPRNCVKGLPCGSSCISKTKTCRKEVTPSQERRMQKIREMEVNQS